PSRPAIYTLSLHDALPISGIQPAWEVTRRRRGPRLRGHQPGRSRQLISTSEKMNAAFDVPLSVQVRMADRTELTSCHDLQSASADRKSTRLNSSHVAISYA